MKNVFPSIPRDARQGFDIGYLDQSGDFTDEITGPNTLVRTGVMDFEPPGESDLPNLEIPVRMKITFGKPRRPRRKSFRPKNVIEMPLRKAS